MQHNNYYRQDLNYFYGYGVLLIRSYNKTTEIGFCRASRVEQWRIQEKGKRKGGCQSIEHEARAVKPVRSAEKCGVTPTSGD